MGLQILEREHAVSSNQPKYATRNGKATITFWNVN